MMEHILAIDQGTSSTKALVVSAGGSVVSSASAPLHTDYSSDGRAEQDAEAIYQSALAATRRCIEELETRGINRSAIACVGIANQRETFVLWDESGPLYNAVVWQCKRSVDICRELANAGTERTIREKSGLIIDPYFSGTKLTSLLREYPKIRQAAQTGRVRFGTVDAWLLWRLTGGAVYACDNSNASRTLMFNIHSLSWDKELSDLLEASSVQKPEVHPSAYNYGSSDFDGIFGEPIPITALVGDSHAALFGERCFSAGQAKATLGTGTSILINAGTVPPAVHPSAMTTIAYGLPDQTFYALEGIIVSAGAILTWLQRDLGFYKDVGELEQLLATVEDAGGVVCIPGHAGMGAPFWQMDARGALLGLTFGTRKAHIIRAALEAIPYQIRAILDAIKEESGVACDAIKVDGGIRGNTFVIDHLVQTLMIPVHTFSVNDVTALGAAFLAGIGAGIFTGVDDISRLDLAESVHTPTAASEATAYQDWRRAMDRYLK